MLFTWSSKNLCIVFPQWRVTGTFSLLVSLVAIVLLTAGYEWIRDMSRRYEERHTAHLQAFTTSTQRMSMLLPCFPVCPKLKRCASRRIENQ
jgi:solute carrier family 31 (copper transporter), member 1